MSRPDIAEQVLKQGGGPFRPPSAPPRASQTPNSAGPSGQAPGSVWDVSGAPSGSRRRILAGFATLATGSLTGTGAQALVLPSNDARLLEMHAAARQAEAEEEAAYSAGGETYSEEGERIIDALAPAAFARREACLFQMAEIPADGLVGVAVKATFICDGMDDGDSRADNALCASLRADIARLVPATVTT